MWTCDPYLILWCSVGVVVFHMLPPFSSPTPTCTPSSCTQPQPTSVKGPPDPYVKIYVTPDLHKKSKQRTKAVESTHNPTYNETVSDWQGKKGLDEVEAHTTLLNWTRTLLSSHVARGAGILWCDTLTSSAFIDHETETDKDPRFTPPYMLRDCSTTSRSWRRGFPRDVYLCVCSCYEAMYGRGTVVIVLQVHVCVCTIVSLL